MPLAVRESIDSLRFELTMQGEAFLYGIETREARGVFRLKFLPSFFSSLNFLFSQGDHILIVDEIMFVII